MQRNFGLLKQQVEERRDMQLSSAAAKLLIYQDLIEEETDFPTLLARRVHELYFQHVCEEFRSRTMWRSNAFTSVQGAGAHPSVQGDSEARPDSVARWLVQSGVEGEYRWVPALRSRYAQCVFPTDAVTVFSCADTACHFSFRFTNTSVKSSVEIN